MIGVLGAEDREAEGHGGLFSGGAFGHRTCDVVTLHSDLLGECDGVDVGGVRGTVRVRCREGVVGDRVGCRPGGRGGRGCVDGMYVR